MSQGFFVYFFFCLVLSRTRTYALTEVATTNSFPRRRHRDVLAQKSPPSADASRRTPVGLCAESVRRGRGSLSHIFTHTYTHIEVHRKETSEKQKRRHESWGERAKLGYVLGCCEYQAPLGLPYR